MTHAQPEHTPVTAPPAQCVDDVTFERLAEQHRPRALRFAIAFVNDRHAAEDIFQEALRRLYERRKEYPLATHFGPYLVKTMARLCIDEKRGRGIEPEPVASHTQSAERDPQQLAEQRETAALINKAVARLSQRERACFLLTVCEGMSYREVAEALSISFSDVNNAIYSARIALRDTLSGVLPHSSGDRA